jgi:alkylhydroperoxidase family enzyme
VGSELGIGDEKLLALRNYSESDLFTDRERTVLEYADAMTITGRDVDDPLFARVQELFSEDEIVELTAIIAFENCSAKFNRALRVPSQKLWKRRSG